MAKRYDYTKVNKEAPVEKMAEEIAEDIIEETVEEEVVEEAVEEAVKEESEEEENLGKIIGCMNLNVRTNPDMESKVVRIVSKNDTVTINGENGDWYEITTKNGDHGYSMKQYIEKM